MQVVKTVKIPVHYATTKEKLDRLNRLTARLTYCIHLLSELIERHNIMSRRALRAKVKERDIRGRTGLNAVFIQQCEDKVLWMWKSYRKLHRIWARKVRHAQHEGNELWIKKLMQREPQPPFHGENATNKKISPRIDARTGAVEWNSSTKLTPLWLKLSTLKLRKTIRVPLNPASCHLRELKRADKIVDFELIKRGKKFHVHVLIRREIGGQPIRSVRGIDLGINRAAATVLLHIKGGEPCEELWLDADRKERIEKFDKVIAQLQQAKRWDKLRKLHRKRINIARYHDWLVANWAARMSDGCFVVIGRADYKRRMFRGDGNKRLRKRVHRWSYARVARMIALKCAERGIPVAAIEEAWTSRICHRCGSTDTRRPMQAEFRCNSCGFKGDADLNAAYNLASRCRVDGLKAGMT